MKLISIVIPHYNDLNNLSKCLAALRNQSWPRDQFEIVVADNNSCGGPAAVEEIAPDVRVVNAKEQGAGPARNAGVLAARGDVLAFIDSDCRADRHWLAEGLEALKHYDYVGGTVITTAANPERISLAEAYEVVFAFNFRKYIEEKQFSGTGNLFVPRVVFEAVGGFRADISEDVDWCSRANRLGYRLGYAEKAIVSHPARESWAALTRKWDRVIRETRGIESQRSMWRWRWFVRALLTAASPFAHAVVVLKSEKLKGLGQRSTCIAGLFAIRFYRAFRMLAELSADA